MKVLSDTERREVFLRYMYYDGRRSPEKWLDDSMVYEIHEAETAPLLVIRQGDRVRYRALLRGYDDANKRRKTGISAQI